MNLADMRGEVRGRIGIDASDPQLNDTTLNQFLQAANRRLGTERDWDWLLTQETVNLVAGTTSYALPADHRRSRLLMHHLPQGNTLEMVNSQLGRVVQLRQRSTYPTHWVVAEDLLQVGPTPAEATTLTHWYYKVPDVLLEGTDSSLLGAAEDLVVVRASKMAAIRMAKKDILVMLDEEDREIFKSLEDEPRRGPSFIRVNSRRDWSA